MGVLDACVKRLEWECKLIEVYFKFVCANGAIRSNPGDKFSITRLKAQCRCSKALWGGKGAGADALLPAVRGGTVALWQSYGYR